jgi:hypothetical protein
MYVPVPSIVDSDTATSVPRVADDGVVANTEHTTNVESLSATDSEVGIMNTAAAGHKTNH